MQRHGLGGKVGLVILGGVSLIRLSGAYQERLDRQGSWLQLWPWRRRN